MLWSRCSASGIASACFFCNASATADIYTLSLHDALPIWLTPQAAAPGADGPDRRTRSTCAPSACRAGRSEEHTSELQSLRHLVCRLLLEKKKELSASQALRASSRNPTRKSGSGNVRQVTC